MVGRPDPLWRPDDVARSVATEPVWGTVPMRRMTPNGPTILFAKPRAHLVVTQRAGFDQALDIIPAGRQAELAPSMSVTMVAPRAPRTRSIRSRLRYKQSSDIRSRVRPI
jgi:hypothetical protein